jgi:hypothetical protein
MKTKFTSHFLFFLATFSFIAAFIVVTSFTSCATPIPSQLSGVTWVRTDQDNPAIMGFTLQESNKILIEYQSKPNQVRDCYVINDTTLTYTSGARYYLVFNYEKPNQIELTTNPHYKGDIYYRESSPEHRESLAKLEKERKEKELKQEKEREETEKAKQRLAQAKIFIGTTWESKNGTDLYTLFFSDSKTYTSYVDNKDPVDGEYTISGNKIIFILSDGIIEATVDNIKRPTSFDMKGAVYTKGKPANGIAGTTWRSLVNPALAVTFYFVDSTRVQVYYQTSQLFEITYRIVNSTLIVIDGGGQMIQLRMNKADDPTLLKYIGTDGTVENLEKLDGNPHAK